MSEAKEPRTANESAYFGMRYLLSKEIATIRCAFDVGMTAKELKAIVTANRMRGASMRFHGGQMISPERLVEELHKAIDYMAENPDAGCRKWTGGENWDWSDKEPFYHDRKAVA
jgi:hypothetical protein